MTEQDQENREEGFYWVEGNGSVEILLWKAREASELGNHWFRAGSEMSVSESEIDFVYPARLRAPTCRMDNSVEEEMGDFPDSSTPPRDGQDLTHACHDCGLKYPFKGLDLFLPGDEWKQIAPEPDGRGILCPNCISIRAEKLENTVCLKASIKRWDSNDVLPSAPFVPFESASDDEL